jgi:LPS-assembly protein
LFDTGVADINFAQIFHENRFTGQDRVSDENQITAALVSRAIEMNGQERLRLALAQRFSSKQSLVVDTPFYTSRVIDGDQITYTTHSTLPSKSDLLFAADGRLNNAFSMNLGWQYSQSFHSTQQINYGFKWQPAPMQVVNAEYRFQQFTQVNPDGMRQIDISAQWPIAPRWYGVARSNFSIQDNRILDGLIGAEYQQDCWIFRIVAQRYLVPSAVAGVTSSSTTSLFFQLELSGLSRIGSNPLEVIKRSIPGYQMTENR